MPVSLHSGRLSEIGHAVLGKAGGARSSREKNAIPFSARVSYTHLSRSQHRATHITQARVTQARYTCVSSPRVTFRCMFPRRRRLLRALVCSSHSLSLKRKKECSQSNKAPFQMTNSCLFFLFNIYIYSPTCLH